MYRGLNNDVGSLRYDPAFDLALCWKVHLVMLTLRDLYQTIYIGSNILLADCCPAPRVVTHSAESETGLRDGHRSMVSHGKLLIRIFFLVI